MIKMIDSRKKIILNEILFWKQNKLLPEHYCDFLATLYSEGEDYEKQDDLSHKQAVLSVEKRNRILISLGLFISVITILYVLFTITTMIWFVSIGVGVIALALIIAAFKMAKNKSLLAPILHIVAALLILGLSVKVCLTYFDGNNIALYGFLILNSVLWLISGLKLKLVYFTVSGALGILVIIGFAFYYFW